MKQPVEIVPEGTLFDRTEWAFADEEPALKKRRVDTEHCSIWSSAMRYDGAEEIVNLCLSPGWTEKELLRAWRRYAKKFGPLKIAAGARKNKGEKLKDMLLGAEAEGIKISPFRSIPVLSGPLK